MNDQSSRNSRKFEREACFARVLLQGVPGQLRDMNKAGFRVVFMNPLRLAKDSIDMVEILPDASFDFSAFKVSAQIKWSREDPFGYLFGFEIKDFPSEADKRKYQELFKYYE